MKKFIIVALIAAGVIGALNHRPTVKSNTETVKISTETVKISTELAGQQRSLAKNIKALPKAPLVQKSTKTPDNYVPAANASQELIDEQGRIVKEGFGSFPAVDLENMNPHKQHVLAALKAPDKNSG